MADIDKGSRQPSFKRWGWLYPPHPRLESGDQDVQNLGQAPGSRSQMVFIGSLAGTSSNSLSGLCETELFIDLQNHPDCVQGVCSFQMWITE